MKTILLALLIVSAGVQAQSYTQWEATRLRQQEQSQQQVNMYRQNQVDQQMQQNQFNHERSQETLDQYACMGSSAPQCRSY